METNFQHNLQQNTHSDLYNTNDFLSYGLNHNFGEMHVCMDSKTGMIAFVALHSTKLGPALGGCRFIEYDDANSAMLDAMRLARGMSYKAASVNLPIGGGKSVIMKPKGNFDRNAYLKTFGQFINNLGGRYITALDSGTQLVDMDIIAEHTPYVASLSKYHGDPSPSTAIGVFHGLQTAVQHKLGKESLRGLHIAIQGLGHVGYLLASHLYAQGVTLTVADINPNLTKRAESEFQAKVVDTKEIHKTVCDVFSPCALGAIINDNTINELNTQIIAGAANNQLAHSYHGQILHDKGILYAPDYVINAGGLVFATGKYFNYSDNQVETLLAGISSSLHNIFERASLSNQPTSIIADQIAQEKLA